MARRSQRAWQRMLSGRRLDLLDPSPMDVEMSDIAHGLARVARWNGQTVGDYPFSVAQHSILVLRIFVALNPDASREQKTYALLHDAAEYVMGDIISPFKAAMGGNYRDVETRLLAAIHIRFALPPAPAASTRKLIKQADQHAAFFEAVNLAGFGTSEARQLFGEPTMPQFDFDGFEQLIRPWPTSEALNRYLSEFERLIETSQS